MRTRFAIPIPVFLLFLPVLARGNPVSLHEAVQSGMVAATAMKFQGHEKVLLELVNLCPLKRRVKFPGTFLRPTRENRQRLALGYQVEKRRGWLDLQEGQVWRGWVTSCCMDQGTPGPENGVEYEVCADPAPIVVTRIMEEWASKPSLSQSLVNDRVWNVMAKHSSPSYPVEGCSLHVWGDDILILVSTGQLIRHLEGDRWDELGSGIRSVGLGYGRILARFGRDAIREYNAVDKTWEDRGKLPEVGRFFIGPHEAMASMGTSLFKLEKGKWVPIRTGIFEVSPAIRPYAHSIAVLGPAHHGPGVELDSSKEREWVVLNRAEFESVACTASKIYCTDSAGVVRLDGTKKKRIGGRSGKIFPHRTGIFVVDRGRNVFEYRDGSDGWSRYELPGGVENMSVDPLKGSFYVVQSTGAILGLSKDWKNLGAIP